MRCALAISLALFCGVRCFAEERLPNIVVIFADDLGYGDVGCFNPKSKIPTPHLDKLAKEGMRFTDAHSPSTVCTPSRYSLLTGRMCFRTGLRGVFTGVDGPLIKKGDPTMATLLKRRGYRTACVGKWHVGMTFLNKQGKPVAARGGGLKKVQQVDFARPISNGPIDAGFDYFFGTACCPTTDFLYAYIENKQVTAKPTRIARPQTRHWLEYEHHRVGLQSPDFEFRNVDLKFLEKSRAFLKKHKQTHGDKPFFLYHATQTAHLPAMPAKQFVGKTKAGPLGDFIFEFDHVVGELLKTLDELSFAKNTLVVVTSDNGPEIICTNLKDRPGHDSAGGWRGLKRDNWEGGHRVPFLVRWPGKTPAGSTCDETICLTDLYATFAAITKSKPAKRAGEDSINLLPVLQGKKPTRPLRDFTMHQTISNALAIRSGKWKYLDHRGSGGNNYDAARLKPLRIESTSKDPGQLYDLQTDPEETRNLYRREEAIRERLRKQLEDWKAAAIKSRTP